MLQRPGFWQSTVNGTGNLLERAGRVPITEDRELLLVMILHSQNVHKLWQLANKKHWIYAQPCFAMLQITLV